MQLSLVIPLRNEQAILSEVTDALAGELDRICGPQQWKFVLVDNGSTDMTAECIDRICEKWPQTIRRYVAEANYGRALRAGLEAVDTPYAHTIDIERWDMPFLEWSWRQRDEHDLFIGSKRADPTLCTEPTLRRILSWGLNALINLLFQYSGSDTHGIKVLRMEAFRSILPLCTCERGQYDTELVLRAFRAGLRIIEAPVTHREVRPPRAAVIYKVLYNVFAFWRLWRKMRSVPFSTGGVRLRRVSREDLGGSEDVTLIHLDRVA